MSITTPQQSSTADATPHCVRASMRNTGRRLPVMASVRPARRLAGAIALASCLSLPSTAMAIPQIGDPPRSDPPAQPSIKIGDTQADYPGTSNGPDLTTAAQISTPPIQAANVDDFDWTDAIIGAGGATALLVVVLGGGTLAARSRARARPLA
jgi:hypothetical protein